MGTAVGAAVGAAVGEADGTAVGENVGATEGCAVGCVVGAPDVSSAEPLSSMPPLPLPMSPPKSPREMVSVVGAIVGTAVGDSVWAIAVLAQSAAIRQAAGRKRQVSSCLEEISLLDVSLEDRPTKQQGRGGHSNIEAQLS